MHFKPRRLIITSSAFAAALTLCGFAVAQSTTPHAPSDAARDFMVKASQSNIAEIEEGRLAMTNSKDPQVQALGNRLVQDHSKAEDTLEALAATMDVKLPAKPDAVQQQEIAKLRSLKGTAFDDVFDPAEVHAHVQTIAEMEQAAANVHNAALKLWIEENVPVLQEHLELARALPGPTGSRRTAQESRTPPASGAAPDRADHLLLVRAMQGNLAEIELGRMAITHSSNPVVLALGTRIAQDGSKGVANVQAIAGMLHVELPSTPSSAEEHQVSELRALKGPEFDHRFEAIALHDEQEMLRQFQSGASKAQNLAVKSAVEDMVPVVEEHIQVAQAIPGQYPTREARLSEGTRR